MLAYTNTHSQVSYLYLLRKVFDNEQICEDYFFLIQREVFVLAFEIEHNSLHQHFMDL